jgi:hypothetical protein
LFTPSSHERSSLFHGFIAAIAMNTEIIHQTGTKIESFSSCDDLHHNSSIGLFYKQDEFISLNRFLERKDEDEDYQIIKTIITHRCMCYVFCEL